MLVARSRRGVDEEVVGLSPQHVREELADHCGLFGAAPDYGVAAVAEEEA